MYSIIVESSYIALMPIFPFVCVSHTVRFVIPHLPANFDIAGGMIDGSSKCWLFLVGSLMCTMRLKGCYFDLHGIRCELQQLTCIYPHAFKYNVGFEFQLKQPV